MRKVLFVLLAIALVGCTAAAMAQQPAPPQGPPQGPPAGMPGMRMGTTCPAMAIAPPAAMMLDRMGSQLGITDDQKTKLTDILTKSENSLKDLRTKADAATKAVHDALFAPTYDSAKVTQLFNDAERIEIAIATSEIATWGEIRGVLTADQVTKLQQTMTRRMGGGFGGNFGGNRGSQGRRNNPNDGQQPPTPPVENAPGQ